MKKQHSETEDTGMLRMPGAPRAPGAPRGHGSKHHAPGIQGSLLAPEPKQAAPGRNVAAPGFQSDSELFCFRHSFTMIVSGPTSCGKTFFVTTLLQYNHIKLSPSPQRIIWLYKRWQPLYDVIKATVRPSVEFIQGVPLDLVQDQFLDPNTSYLIILDDLMSTAAKDQRISDLFTEGSHHRNLSVIAINQYIYYSKDPTQRRNCLIHVHLPKGGV